MFYWFTLSSKLSFLAQNFCKLIYGPSAGTYLFLYSSSFFFPSDVLNYGRKYFSEVQIEIQ